jgi:hypothetical protein
MSDLDLHEPTRLTYPYRNEALGRIEAKVDALVSVVEMGEAKAPPPHLSANWLATSARTSWPSHPPSGLSARWMTLASMPLP